ncbi:MAG: hypothetical protein OEQ39_08550 [Gammaproteobacteria bacterium]|nr:hypothetical protein [Gammaproteobacteria bacterium]
MLARLYSTITAPPWWLWTTLIHLFFVTIAAAIIFRAVPGWLESRDSALSLYHESNYAVWWSGYCFLAAGVIFYAVAGRVNTAKDRLMWAVVAAVVLALSADEIGSLHERVSRAGGWWALLPFAVIGTGAFGYAIGRTVLTPAHRLSGILILSSLLIFFAVAGLEFVEHNYRFKSSLFARGSLVFEEAIELFAASLLILSATLAFRKTKLRIKKTSIVVNPSELPLVREVLFLGLLMHLLVAIDWVPYLWEPRRSVNYVAGNPVFWYPLFVFLILIYHCVSNARNDTNVGAKAKWLVGAVIFFLLSTGQLYNHGYFISGFLDNMPERYYAGYHATVLWTVIPLLIYMAAIIPIRYILSYGILLGLVIYTLDFGRNEYFEKYYILSGFLSYLCFYLFTRFGAGTTAR